MNRVTAADGLDCEITGHGRVRVFVIAAREDIEITHAVRTALPQHGSRPPTDDAALAETGRRSVTSRSAGG